MRKLLSMAVMAMAIAVIFPSCVSKKKFTELMSLKESREMALTETEQKLRDTQTNVKDLEGQVGDLNSQKNELEKKTTMLSSDLNETKENLAKANKEADEIEKKAEMLAVENEKLSKAKTGVKGVFTPYESSGLNLAQQNEQVVIAVPGGILFKSGSARLNSEQKESLRTVATTLASNPSLKLVVEGHTDTVPMKEGAPWANNWQLSIARAKNVVKALVSMGANEEQLSTVGRSHDMPAITMETPTTTDLAQNRRAELVVMANAGELYQISQSL